MPSTCSAPGCVFSTRSGHGVPEGYVLLEAFRYTPYGERCRRYGELMAKEEAEAEGLAQGYLVWFRDTDSFWQLAAHFWQRRDTWPPNVPTSFELLCQREELDPDQVYLGLLTRCLVAPDL